MTDEKIMHMDKASIERIVAGQAITDLASAIKELVENSLDAGAKSINIRLINQGLDAIEVSDDGCGVPTQSRSFLAMKHATSKIQQFDDIYSIASTLGFRGEALFCLANLSSKLVVTTRTSVDTVGQRLEYGRDGLLKDDKTETVPRKQGTTVTVHGFLEALPVRRADLKKRINAQRQRLVTMMQGYGILCLGVRFNLIDVDKKGKESVKLRTISGAQKIEQTVSSVLGSKFLSGMSPIRVDLSPLIKQPGDWMLEGLLSNAATQNNRDGARESQFFSINGRPVDLPKISKALSEIWRSQDITVKKRPACVFRISLPKDEYDVNLSPDKRQVLLTQEEAICDLIQKAALEFWIEQRDGKFILGQVAGKSQMTKIPQSVIETSIVTPKAAPAQFATGSKGSQPPTLTNFDESPTKPLLAPKEGQPLEDESFFSQTESKEQHDPKNDSSVARCESPPREDKCDAPTVSQEEQVQHDSVPPIPCGSTNEKVSDQEKREWVRVRDRFRKTVGIDPQLKEIQTLRPSSVTPDLNEKKEEQVKTKLTLEDFAFTPLKKSRKLVPCQSQQQHTRQTVRHGGREQGKSHSKSGTQNPYLKRNPYLSSQKNQNAKAVSQPRLVLPVGNQTSTSDDENSDSDGSSVADEVVWKVFAGTKTILANSRKRRIELEERRQRLKRIQTERAEGTKSNRKKEEVVGLKKEDFGSMEVVGQFNMGFILAKCRNNHLWVLDQHACDEKYNFERLCKTTEIREQKLLHPMQLDLSPSEEACVLDHMNVFEKNGFRFQYDPDKAPRQRLSLTGLPHSGARDGCKAVQFGKDDVSALCALLGVTDGSSFSQDGGTGADGSGLYGNNAVRRYAGNSSQLTQQQDDNMMAMLPKTIAMFANRACRGSIMVGKALSQKEMESIVEKLKEVNHPWNCPHGRPTTRHVSDVLDDLICDTKRSLRCLTEPTVSIMPTTQLTQVEEES